MSTDEEKKAKQSAAYAKWYAKNRAVLSERRKKRYAEDPDYRARILKSAADTRAVERGSDNAPDGYQWNQTEVCSRLGIYSADLKRWRDQEFIPEPVEAKNQLMFTEEQVQLLDKLAKYFALGGKKDDAQRAAITTEIYANW